MAALTVLLLGLPGHLAARECAAESEEAWQAHEQAAWRDLAAGRRHRVSGDGDLSDFVAGVLLCAGRAAALPSRGMELEGARLDDLGLDHAEIGIRFSCRDCRLANFSAARSRWRRDLDLSGSRFLGGADLSHASVAGDLRLDGVVLRPSEGQEDPALLLMTGLRVDGALSADDAVIDGGLSLVDGAVGADLSLNGTALRALILDGVRVGGSASLRGGGSDAVLSLAGAAIKGSLDLRRFESRAPLAAERVEAGALRLDGAALPGLELEGARVGGHLVLSGATIARAADLDGVVIEGDLWIRSYEGGPPPVIGAEAEGDAVVLSLNNARIDGRIDVSGARFGGAISLDAARIGEDVWLRRGSGVEGAIVAVYARIGQNVDLSGSRLGDIDLTGGRIGGELRLGAPNTDTLSAPEWRPGATLTLRNVEASAWVDSVADGADNRSDTGAPCDREEEPWPETIDVIGFSYDRIGGLGGGSQVIREACDWYVGWLGRQQPFSLDPYRRLAEHLDAGGRAAAARRVRWAAKERQLDNASGLEFWRLFLQKIFVGYGIFTYAVFLWMAAFVVLGRVVFSFAPEAKHSNVPLGYVFSLDMLLPFLSFRRAHGEVDLESPFRFYLYFHKFMGWVFALFFVSALTGLFAV